MQKIRTIISYKNHFENFLAALPEKVQNKIYKVLEIVEFQKHIPAKFIKHIEGTEGLFETRFSLGNNIWRVFCFFDEGNLVILLNGFQKKTQKTPPSEIKKAEKLKNEYYNEKRRSSNEKK
jgi:phage-related protein